MVFNIFPLASVLLSGFSPGVYHCPLLHAGGKITPAAVVALKKKKKSEELMPLFLFKTLDEPGLAFLLTFLKMWFSYAA